MAYIREFQNLSFYNGRPVDLVDIRKSPGSFINMWLTYPQLMFWLQGVVDFHKESIVPVEVDDLLLYFDKTKSMVWDGESLLGAFMYYIRYDVTECAHQFYRLRYDNCGNGNVEQYIGKGEWAKNDIRKSNPKLVRIFKDDDEAAQEDVQVDLSEYDKVVFGGS